MQYTMIEITTAYIQYLANSKSETLRFCTLKIPSIFSIEIETDLQV
jgi:hypothetical protein